MIFGVKCEGCRMWTRVMYEDIPFIARHGLAVHYYCDKCFANVTYHTTKATITNEV